MNEFITKIKNIIKNNPFITFSYTILFIISVIDFIFVFFFVYDSKPQDIIYILRGIDFFIFFAFPFLIITILNPLIIKFKKKHLIWAKIISAILYIIAILYQAIVIIFATLFYLIFCSAESQNIINHFY